MTDTNQPSALIKHNKYNDDDYEYLILEINTNVVKRPMNDLLSTEQLTQLGLKTEKFPYQWEHFYYYELEPNMLALRRKRQYL